MTRRQDLYAIRKENRENVEGVGGDELSAGGCACVGYVAWNHYWICLLLESIMP